MWQLRGIYGAVRWSPKEDEMERADIYSKHDVSLLN